MRKLISTVAAVLGASSAYAADLPVKAPVLPPPPPVFSWTGFYIGGNIGAAWSHHDVTDTITGLNFSRTSDGVFIGGGQVGFNYQIGGFVWGVEGDFDWAGNNGNGTGITTAAGNIAASAHDKWISSVAARFGFASDHWLFYGKAGGGWVGASNVTFTNTTTGASITGGRSSGNNGFLFGAGIEYAFTNNWTMKVEYDHLSLDSRTFIISNGAPFFPGDVFSTGHRSVQEFKVGINYLFNSARY